MREPEDEPESKSPLELHPGSSPAPAPAIPVPVPVPAPKPPSAHAAPKPPIPASPHPPSDPPAKPPTPPPEGLQSMPIAPVERGPAIPVPGLEKKNWGDENYQADPEGTVYGGILGTVQDEVTKEALENVEISIPELDLRALTDRSGMFMIRGIRVRSQAYEVLLKLPGYQTRFESLKLEKKGTSKQEFLLAPMGW